MSNLKKVLATVVSAAMLTSVVSVSAVTIPQNLISDSVATLSEDPSWDAPIVTQNETVHWTFPSLDIYTILNYPALDKFNLPSFNYKNLQINSDESSSGIGVENNSDAPYDVDGYSFEPDSKLNLRSGSSTTNTLSFIPGKSGKLTIYVRNAGSSAGRTLYAEQNGQELIDYAYDAKEAKAVFADVEAEEQVTIYANANLQVYGIFFDVEGSQPSNVPTIVKKAYNEASGSADVEITNAKDKNIVIMVGEYNAQGLLVKTYSEPKTVASDDETYTVSAPITSGNSAKVFVWYGTDSLEPLNQSL